MADQTTDSLDVAMNKLSDQRFQIHTRFRVADLASRRQLFLRPAGRDQHVLVADQPACLDRRDGIAVNLHARMERQHHERPVVLQPDPLHLADLHSGDLHGRARLEPRDGIEFRLELNLIPAPDDFELAELDRHVRQGGDADQDEDPDDELQFCVMHGYRASWTHPEVTTSGLGPTLMNSRTEGCRVRWNSSAGAISTITPSNSIAT